MSEKRVTLKDISSVSGLSVPVVSRILNGKETYCSERKIAEVRDIARRLGYRPNVGYNIMTGKETNIAGIIFSQKRITHNHHITQLYMNLCSKLRERNFASYSMVMSSSVSPEEQLRHLQELDDLGCRYYIFIGHPAGYEKYQEFIQHSGRNFICMNNFSSPRRIITDIAGANVSYIRSCLADGMENFKIVATSGFMEHSILPKLPSDLHDFIRRRTVAPNKLAEDSPSPDVGQFRNGYEIMQQELRSNPEIASIVFPSDYHALGAAKALFENNIRGVKLHGMNCSLASKYAPYPITTTEFDMDKCADLLLDNMSGSDEVNIELPGKEIYFNLFDNF